ncbi:MAG TPA: hypothetical protein PLK58_18470, partial [Candidatus Rifleibacterium sp.]|nr:hypothetical protein [Candidatus Rifleibacterium sp.]
RDAGAAEYAHYQNDHKNFNQRKTLATQFTGRMQTALVEATACKERGAGRWQIEVAAECHLAYQ